MVTPPGDISPGRELWWGRLASGCPPGRRTDDTEDRIMAGDTVITIIGNLTSDPELRWTPSGAAVANFTIASTPRTLDRKSTRLNSSHANISYAVFCLKKKKNQRTYSIRILKLS